MLAPVERSSTEPVQRLGLEDDSSLGMGETGGATTVPRLNRKVGGWRWGLKRVGHEQLWKWNTFEKLRGVIATEQAGSILPRTRTGI